MPKKIPMRMCCGCSGRKPKGDLVRVLKTPQGQVELDLTGKKAGRGAYICKNSECFGKAQKNGRLARNLETEIPPEVYEALAQQLDGEGDE